MPCVAGTATTAWCGVRDGSTSSTRPTAASKPGRAEIGALAPVPSPHIGQETRRVYTPLMRTRFLAALLIAATAAISAAPAGAQSGHWLTPPDKLPQVGRGDKTRNLDFLFGALQVAPDDVTAKAIEERIWALW